MRKWKLVAGVLLVFSAGLLVGSFGTKFGLRYFLDRFKYDTQYRVDFVLGRLSRRLDLNESQKKNIRKIIVQADLELNQYWINVLAEADQKVNLVKAEIKQELNPDQVVRFEKMSANINARRRKSPSFSHTPAPVKQTP